MRAGANIGLALAIAMVSACGDSDSDADAGGPVADAVPVADVPALSDAPVPDAPVAPEGDAQLSCPISGNAHVFGSVAGVELGEVQRVQLALGADGFDKILIRESAAPVCDLDAQLEHFLTLAFTCPPISPGTYPIGAPSSPCPAGGDEAMALFQRDGGFTLGIAESGTIEIELVEGNCAVGSFELDFPDGDSLVGSFGSIRC